MASSMSTDPFGAFAFQVEIDGVVGGFFQEVSGLGATIEVQEVQEGGRNDTTRKLVGVGKYPNLVFKRGLCTGTMLDALLKFRDAASKTRLSGTITMLSNRGEAIHSWKFEKGFPVKWDGPQLNVGQNAIAVESLEIAHEGLTTQTIKSPDREGK